METNNMSLRRPVYREAWHWRGQWLCGGLNDERGASEGAPTSAALRRRVPGLAGPDLVGRRHA
jgi:hypothetical protein